MSDEKPPPAPPSPPQPPPHDNTPPPPTQNAYPALPLNDETASQRQGHQPGRHRPRER